MAGAWSTVFTLIRYWIKGRFTRTAAIAILMGEGFSIFAVLFVGSTYLSFSNRFKLGSGLSEAGLSLIMSLFLVGLVQSGFNGSGLPVSSADVDYVFTSPVRPREIFTAKVLMNSFTTVLLSFPPVFALYVRFSIAYGSSYFDALFAGLVTLVFFTMALVLSADVTLSLSSSIAERVKAMRNVLIGVIVVISLLPITIIIPGIPGYVADAVQLLPSGLAASMSADLIAGNPWSLIESAQLAALIAWLGTFVLLGIRMSRNHFYEVLQVGPPGGSEEFTRSLGSELKTEGRSVWSIVRSKESIIMRRTKERRSLVINGFFLSGFMVIYSLSGIFQSSPTSFLLILFIIGSFGSGTASRWLEKERLWIIKTSAIDVRRYVKEVFRARVAPLLLVLAPVAIAVGVPLILSEVGRPGSLLSLLLAVPGALEVASMMMGGSMYFSARYGQSTADELMSSQGQDLTDIRRFLYQTVINLALVSPLMGLVLGAGYLGGAVILWAPVLMAISLLYTYVALDLLLNAAGDSIKKREDL